jgi:hypothetical protein
MACTTCATTKSGVDSYSNTWVGSLIGGAKRTKVFARKIVPVNSLRVPSTVIFDENPYLSANSKFSLINISSISGAFTGVNECATVVTAPVLANGKWEVVTDLTMTSLTGSPTYSTSTQSVGSNSYNGFGCPPSAVGTTGAILNAVLCDGIINASNFTGYVYTRMPGGNGTGFDAYVVSNQPTITASKRSIVKIGDKIVLPGTAINDDNPATVIAIAVGTRKDGQPISIITLNLPVTGITASPDTQGLICIGAVASPQPIANIKFTQACNCAIVQTIDNVTTSSSSFPPGLPFEEAECGQTKYCYVIHDFTLGSNTPDEFGTLIL